MNATKAKTIAHTDLVLVSNQLHRRGYDSPEMGWDWETSYSLVIPNDWPSDLYEVQLRLDAAALPSYPGLPSIPTDKPTIVEFALRRYVPPKRDPLLVDPNALVPGVPHPDPGLRPPVRIPIGDAADDAPAASRPRVLVVFPFARAAAYNWWPRTTSFEYANEPVLDRGDWCAALYDGPPRRRRASLDRPQSELEPMRLDERTVPSFLFANGIDYDVCSNLDLDGDSSEFLSRYDVLIFSGHDEYWSWSMRDAVESFCKSGGNACFFTGNTSWWQVRLAPGRDGRKKRTIVCYKSALEDPIVEKDPRRATTIFAGAPANRPENRMLGLSYRYGALSSPGIGQYSAVADEGMPWARWVLEGTGLNVGDAFGRLGMGYETDGFETDYATGKILARDGTPRNLQVVAFADLRTWRGAPIDDELDLLYGGQGGNAAIAFFRAGAKGGIVFHGGTLRWGLALASDSVIQRITLNVVRALAARPAAVGPVPAAEYDEDVADLGIAWQEVDAAIPPGVTSFVGLTGMVEGHLFATTADGTLLRRPPYVGAAPWTIVPVTVAAPGLVTALGAGILAPSRLYGAVGKKLVERAPVVDAKGWFTAAVDLDAGRIVGIGVPLDGVWAATEGDSLYFAMARWVRVGRTPVGTTSMCGVDRMLLACTRELELFAREAIAYSSAGHAYGVLDLRWRRIGNVPPGTVAIGCYYGRLFAMDAAGTLRWRSATALSEDGTRIRALHPGYVITYRATSLTGVLRAFSLGNNGDVRLEGTRFVMSGATDFVGAGDGRHAVLFDRYSGAFEVIRVTPTYDEETTDFRVVIEIMSADTLPVDLSSPYRGAALVGLGVIAFRRGAGAASVLRQVRTDGKLDPIGTTLLPNSSHVVGTHEHDLIAYDADSGRATYARYGLGAIELGPSAEVGRGWDFVIPVGHHKLLFAQRDGAFLLVRVTTPGSSAAWFEPLSCAPTTLTNFADISLAVGGSNGLALFYRSIDGRGAAGGTFDDALDDVHTASYQLIQRIGYGYLGIGATLAASI